MRFFIVSSVVRLASCTAVSKIMKRKLARNLGLQIPSDIYVIIVIITARESVSTIVSTNWLRFFFSNTIIHEPMLVAG